MSPLSNTPGYVAPLTVSPKTIEALERLRESYKGKLAWEALIELDQAVLMAVEITLQQFKNADSVA